MAGSMIRGVVNARREAVVPLRVRGPSAVELDVDAVVTPLNLVQRIADRLGRSLVGRPDGHQAGVRESRPATECRRAPFFQAMEYPDPNARFLHASAAAADPWGLLDERCYECHGVVV